MRNGGVLIIDDNEDYLWMLSTLFQKHFNITPTAASSVDQAEPFLNNHEFDLVISDFHMPGKNGREVIRILVEQNKFMPLIFFTSEDMPPAALAQKDFPCVVVSKKDHHELLEIASEFLHVPPKMRASE